tara:strand:- start:97510 stop:98559 length:1050 start_codon:yes stop_codon:yes gene_type:complete
MSIILGDIIEQQISKRVFFSFCILALIIASLDFVFIFLSELSDLSNNYGVVDAFIYSLYKMPYIITGLLPYICLIAVLVAMGSLIEDGEIIGARSLGKSKKSIVFSTLRPIFLISILGLLSSQFLVPSSSQYAEENKLIKLERINPEKGYWISTDNYIGYISAAPSTNYLQGITIFKLDNDFNPREILKADHAQKVNKEWVLYNIDFLSPEKKYISKLLWNEGPSEGDLSLVLSPKYLSLSNLYKSISLVSSEYRKNSLEIEFLRKILQPIFIFSLVFFASIFIFGPTKDMKLGQRVILGVLIAFSLSIFQRLLESLALASFLSPIISSTLPSLLIVTGAFLLFRRFTN